MKRAVICCIFEGLLLGCAGGEGAQTSEGNYASAGVVSATAADDDEPDDEDDEGEPEDSGTGGPADDDDVGESSVGPDDDSSDSAEGCDQEQFSFVVEAHAPNVMLVLDKSRSMTALWNHDANPITPEISRWHSLHNVVTGLLSEFGDQFNFGAQLFPAATAYLDEPTNNWSCRVAGAPEVAVAAGTSAAILAAMPAAGDFDISGGTPATEGLRNAFDHLETVDGEGPKAIVFVTDGAANCSDNEAAEDTLFVYDDEVPDVISAGFAMQSIPVYVVGINIVSTMGTKPAVNAHDAITDAANAGGAPAPGPAPFYNAFNELELGDALDDVLTDIECTVNLEVEPDFPSSVAVTVDLMGYPNLETCGDGDGWAFSDPAGPFNAIQLCGRACDALQDGGLVEVEYLCPG